ncbi:S24 family peptidase [Kitasatospora sp. NPDC002551]|uniref:LexA family protein n=1 Tax=Kitasatospora sp. NPDC002551 TaxID=3154539 RepID=UPI003327B3F8
MPSAQAVTPPTGQPVSSRASTALSRRPARTRFAHRPCPSGRSHPPAPPGQPRPVWRTRANIHGTAPGSAAVIVPVNRRWGGEVLARNTAGSWPEAFRNPGTRWLPVRGDSMIEAGICDGDWVTVRRQPTAENGQIVAAMIDGEATVKRLRHRDGTAWLMPANPVYEPLPGAQATILGRVVAVLRSL